METVAVPVTAPVTVAVSVTDPPPAVPGSRTKSTSARCVPRSSRPGFVTNAAVGAAPAAGRGLAAMLSGSRATTVGTPDQVTVGPLGSASAPSMTFRARASPATAAVREPDDETMVRSPGAGVELEQPTRSRVVTMENDTFLAFIITSWKEGSGGARRLAHESHHVHRRHPT